MDVKVSYVIFTLIKTASVLQVRFSTNNSTSQSKTIAEKYSNLAIDGDINSCAISQKRENELAWWSVKLDKDYNIERIIINYNSRSEHTKYMNHFDIFVSKNEMKTNLCTSYKGKSKDIPRLIILNCEKPIIGNLVTIKRFGGLFRKWLVLCEVVILADIEIISFNKPTSHNGIIFKNTSGLAVDGNNESCTKIIAKKGEFALWRVFLDGDYYIDKVVIYYNPNSSDVFTIKYFNVYVSNDYNKIDKDLCENFNATTQLTNLNGVIELKCREPKPRGKYVTIKKIGGTLSHQLQGLCEIEVYSKEFSKFNQMFIADCEDSDGICIPLLKCIPEYQLCNRIKNCPDGTDEFFCKCLPHQHQCKGYESYDCIPKDWLCDGFRDCSRGDDEETGCDCPESTFKCVKRQKCINSEKRCDGVNDCPDHSDEKYCFSFEDRILLALYKGKPDYYICSTNWDTINSRQMCNYLSYSLMFTDVSENFTTYEFKQLKFLTLKNREAFENNIPSIAHFNENNTCASKKIVQIECKQEINTNNRSMCGKRAYPDADLETYIINGKVAKVGAWPWHVQLFRDGVYACGGSLIRNNWVLTATHCTENLAAWQVTVKVGAHLLDDPNVPRLSISHIVNHPLYSDADDINDIALIRIAKPVEFTDDVKPICLPNGIMNNMILKTFSYCMFTGFGDIDRDHTTSPYLMQGRMNLMTDEECAENVANIGGETQDYYKRYIMQRDVMCAGSAPTKFGVTTCWGDSGGPLICKDKNDIWTQIGLLAFAFRGIEIRNCTNSVFTAVNRHTNFINRALQREDEFSAGAFKLLVGIVPFIVAISLMCL